MKVEKSTANGTNKSHNNRKYIYTWYKEKLKNGHTDTPIKCEKRVERTNYGCE